VNTKTRFSILIVTDDRLSKEKTHVLNRTIYELKQEFEVELIRGDTHPKEAQILEKIKKSDTDGNGFHLILAPLRHYFEWQRIENYWGPMRTSGPTFAGYFSEAVSISQLPESLNQERKIILDLCNTSIHEQLVLLRALISDKLRTGILPLLPPKTPIYFENWYTDQGLGNRFDQILNLPEIAKTDWLKRASTLQILLSALWGIVYGGKLGKNDLKPTSEKAAPKANLQIGVDASCLVFRLCFTTVPRLLTHTMIQLFSHHAEAPSQPRQLLLQYGDFLRVHTLGETSEIELVVGLFPSAPSEKAHHQLHTLWLEPISANLVSELPNQVPSPEAPHLRILPAGARIVPNLRLIETKQETKPDTNQEIKKQSDQKDLEISHASSKIADLSEKVKEREAKIKELKQGGVGNTTKIEPPDAEALLEGFQERYFDAKHQIRQFEIEIDQVEKRGGTAQEIHTLRLKMDALRNREAAWIRKLMTTIELFKNSKN
jgi:hypothetical protein